MTIEIHTIDANQHREFLNERRKDPFSKQELKAGDHIVFCAGCRSAFLISSWEAMGNRHRDCSDQTLELFPTFKIKFGNAQLKAENHSLINQNNNLNTQNDDLKEQIKQVKLIQILCNCIIIGLGFFCFYQYNSIEGLNTHLKTQDQQKSTLKQELDDIDNKISKLIKLSECTQEKKQKIEISLHNKVEILEEKQKCLIETINSAKEDKEYYKNILDQYPFSLLPGKKVEYNDYLYSDNNESNPIVYSIYVNSADYYDICLCGFNGINGQFEIIDKNGTSLVKSGEFETSSSDYLNKYYLNSGSYSIKVWNSSSDKSSSYTLKIYRYVNN